VKKSIFILFISLILLTTSCNPMYRILTVDYEHVSDNTHKYEVVNIKTGVVITIYDSVLYSPGKYVTLSSNVDDSLKIDEIIQ
jgi:hypothetical protein